MDVVKYNWYEAICHNIYIYIHIHTHIHTHIRCLYTPGEQ